MSDPARYLLMKRGLYYRPENCGYTGIKDHAGRYRPSEANPESGVTAVHEDEAPDFSPACFDDLKIDHLLRKIADLKMRVREAARLAIKAQDSMRAGFPDDAYTELNLIVTNSKAGA